MKALHALKFIVARDDTTLCRVTATGSYIYLHRQPMVPPETETITREEAELFAARNGSADLVARFFGPTATPNPILAHIDREILQCQV